MPDREDLPFISFDENEPPKPPAKPTPPKSAPAKGAAAQDRLVDMVSKPTGKGTAKREAPASTGAGAGTPPMTLPSAATISEADGRNAPVTKVDQVELIDDEPGLAATAPARMSPKKADPIPPPSAVKPPMDDAESLLRQHKAVEEGLRNYARVTKERDEVRAKVASLEHELAQARRQIAELKEIADKVKELREKLDQSLLSHSMLSTENAKFKMRANELEEKLRQAEQRAQAAEAAQKKAESAVQAARDARDESEKRIAAALAALQAKGK